VPEPGTPMVPLEAVFYECAVSVAFALEAHAVPWPADPPGTVRIRTDDLATFTELLRYWAGEKERIPVSVQDARSALARLRAILDQEEPRA
jgi:hypothetical protein